MVRNSQAWGDRGSQRGFTMVEMAIVLAVIAVVLGSMMAVVPDVYRNVRINKATESLPMIVGNVRALYASRMITYAALNAVHAINAAPSAADIGYYTPLWITAGVFPADMVSGATVNAPWSGGVVETSLIGTTGNPVQIDIRYTKVPVSICANLVLQTAAVQDQKMVLQDITVGGTDLGGPPVLPAAVTAACGAGVDIDWVFDLGGA